MSFLRRRGNLAAYFGPIIATGGDDVFDETIGGVLYRIHVFTTVGSSQAFEVQRVSKAFGDEVEYLIVGGGGRHAGVIGVIWNAGGGGGEVLQGSTVIARGVNAVTVGGAGESSPSPPQAPSSAFLNITAAGGFRAADGNLRGGTSGSGNLGGTNISTSSGGGGGDSEAGQNAVNSSVPGRGGNGTQSNIDGQNLFYGGGGGGRRDQTAAAEGLGGPSRANSGGGGGEIVASSRDTRPPQAGIVIVRYPLQPV